MRMLIAEDDAMIRWRNVVVLPEVITPITREERGG